MLQPRAIARLVVGLIILIFGLTTPALLLAYNVQQTVTRQAIYEQLLDSPAVFEEALPEMAQELAQAVRQDNQARRTPPANLSVEDWQAIVKVVAPPRWLQGQAQAILDAFFGWLRSGEPFLQTVRLPLGQARDHILQDESRTVLRVLIAAQPNCMPGQESLDQEADLLPACRPPEADLDEFRDRLWRRWQERPDQLWRQLFPGRLGEQPEDVSLAQWSQSSDAELEAKIGWRSTRGLFRLSSWLLLGLIGLQALFVFSLVGLLLTRSWPRWLLWGGLPLTLAGFLSLLLGISILVIAQASPFGFGEVSEGLTQVLRETLRTFLHMAGLPLLWQGGVLLVVGAGMWLISLLWLQNQRAPAVAASAPAESPPDQSQKLD